MASWFRSRKRRGKPRVLYVLTQYPLLSESYIKTEIKYLIDDYDILPISKQDPEVEDPDHVPYEVIHDRDDIERRIREYKPDLLHSHWLVNARDTWKLARKTNTPFTIRGHSFDTLRRGARAPHLNDLERASNDPLCLGILVFPYARKLLEDLGVPPEKIVEAPPVIDFDLFYDRSPNSGGVMGVGACLPKKKFEDLVDLSVMVPDQEFDLYALGHDIEKIRAYNAEKGGHVNIMRDIRIGDMPAEYKRHRWLVYTGCKEIGTLGWSISVSEAMASGTGVCLANLRPDLQDYVGEAGYLFDSLEEVRDIVTRPLPEERREKGFEQARRFDIKANKHLLTDLWQKVL